jgi:branched-chain amino acid transport system substrate-binding protein
MRLTRRDFSRLAGAGALAAAAPSVFSPAIAQDKPLKIGIIAPRSGVVGTAGECGIRAVQWATERLNKSGGIAGRKIELALRKRPTQGHDRTFPTLDPAGKRSKPFTGCCRPASASALRRWRKRSRRCGDVGWHHAGWRQGDDAEPRYVFRSTDNECEAVMGSLLAIKYLQGKVQEGRRHQPRLFLRPQQLGSLQADPGALRVESEFVAEQWPKVGTMDLTSHIAALNASKPDLIFSSMLFADLPVFMKQGHARGAVRGRQARCCRQQAGRSTC